MSARRHQCTRLRNAGSVGVGEVDRCVLESLVQRIDSVFHVEGTFGTRDGHQPEKAGMAAGPAAPLEIKPVGIGQGHEEVIKASASPSDPSDGQPGAASCTPGGRVSLRSAHGTYIPTLDQVAVGLHDRVLGADLHSQRLGPVVHRHGCCSLRHLLRGADGAGLARCPKCPKDS